MQWYHRVCSCLSIEWKVALSFIMAESHDEKGEVKGYPDILMEEVLGDMYHKDQILAKEIGIINDTRCELTYVFPPFAKTIHPLPHVSSDQMQLACIEGLYCTIGHAIKQKALKDAINIDYSTFLSHRHDVAILEEGKEYRREVQPNVEEKLAFFIQGHGIKKFRREFYYVIVNIDGFLRGHFTCLLPVDVMSRIPQLPPIKDPKEAQ